MASKSNNANFIAKAIKKHGDKYSYEKSKYVRSTVKVVITCPTHGDFEQTPNAHLSGKGCMQCSGKKRKTKESFEKESRKIHGDKYDYSLVKYESVKKKVKIVCPIHGEFMQRPDIHLSGHGCYSCGRYDFSKTMTHTNDEFIKESIKTHGGKYDYSEAEYSSAKGKVRIICKNHGPFFQTAYVHKNGGECPQCRKHSFDSSLESFVYIATSDDFNYMKIGITNDVEKRKISLGYQTPFDLKIKVFYKTKNARDIETNIKRIGVSAGLSGFHGHTEWIEYDDNIIDVVRFMCSL